MKRKCIQCGKEFEITDSEKKFYAKKNMVLPKRCKECRTLNKLRSKNQTESIRTANFKKNPRSKFIPVIIALIAIAVLLGLGIYKHAGHIPTQSEGIGVVTENSTSSYVYQFKTQDYLEEHFEKHGAEFGYSSAEDYVEGANRVISLSAALHKLEREDGDDIYYLEITNELVIVSTQGYIRTYFKPEDGKSYYDRQ